MATTVTKSNYWIFTTTSDTTPVFNFKFVCDVYMGATKVARLKQPKNDAGSAHFNVERIVKNYTEMTNEHSNTVTGTVDYSSIHLMPRNIPNPSASSNVDFSMSANTDTIKLVTLKWYEEYASTDGGAITVSSQSATDNDLAYINYADEWEDQMNFDSEYYDMDDSVTSQPSRFLTRLPLQKAVAETTLPLRPINHLTGVGDYRTLSWLNERTTYFNTLDFIIQIKFYTQEPTYLNYLNITPGIWRSQIQIPAASPTYGGYPPNVSGSLEDKMLLFIGAGYENVSKMKYFDLGNAALESTDTFYTIQACGDTPDWSSYYTDMSAVKPGEFLKIKTVGTTDFTLIGSPDNVVGTTFYATGPGTGTGEAYWAFLTPYCLPYTFEIKRETEANSNKYDGYSIAWKNKFGTWDYHYFDMVSRESVTTNRSIQYEKNPGTWNSATFSINSWDRGKVETVKGSKVLTVNTRFLDENFNTYFREMMQSNDIQLISPVETGDDGIEQLVIPLVLKTSSLNYKTVLNDKLIQYTFTFEYAHGLKQYI